MRWPHLLAAFCIELNGGRGGDAVLSPAIETQLTTRMAQWARARARLDQKWHRSVHTGAGAANAGNVFP